MRFLVVSLTLVLASILLAVAVPKLTGQVQMRERMAHLGVSPGRTRMIGGLEIAAVGGLLLGLLWPPIGVAAAIGVVLLMIGAAVYHARAKDPVSVTVVPVVFAAAAGALAVLPVVNG
ncbi:DoxX family protein [Micromonospora sp. WMMA1363]|uniref:DoxX family protein n=1 Tax=Micromonospora sp. WMMA1363 TaxID=3053985 RepID=UPI00259CAEB1|nr:DoxX family protein [Micromonospora sp. WMMA1363]MDM4723043.1 DoxX family protein [Micromonospora sp. WMMA1363]